MTTRGTIVVWTLALVAAAAVAAAVATSDHASGRAWTIALSVPTGLAFVASGLVVRARRPDNRIGILLVAAGFGSFIGGLKAADDEFLFTFGQALQWAYFGFIVHVVLAFPSGRLVGTADRVLASVAYALALAMLPLLMVFEEHGHVECGRGPCPENVLAIAPNTEVAGALDAAHLWVAVTFVGAVLLRLALRWRSAEVTPRHAMTPVYAAFALLMTIVAAQHVAEAGLQGAVPVINWLLLGALLLVPLAFLFGLFRTRFGTAVERLVVELGTARPGTVRDALAKAIGDPSLDLAYSIGPDQYVDSSGRECALPVAGSGRRATLVRGDGETIAALIHDESLAGDPLLEPIAAAAALALENERLNAELRARLEDLRASRARLVQAGDEARRRLERNLHDGAQQRLVTLALSLRLAQSKVKDDPAAAEQMMAAAGDEAAGALEDLRELARGLHPAILSDQGLRPALEALATRSPCPVDLVDIPTERLPRDVETAAYYVVAESLTNVAKYAAASRATVSVTRRDGSAVVEIRDDGIGGATIDSGSGLRGLADRVEALDGQLSVRSPKGEGTLVAAEIPLGEGQPGCAHSLH